MTYDLLTFGSAVIDKVICINDAFLESKNFEKGGTRAYLNQDQQQLINEISPNTILPIPGGSAGNTTKVASGLGLECAYIAKIGNDQWGQLYKNSFIERDIKPYFSTSSSLPTGSILCLITPDGERTICPDLRACQSIQAEDIQPSYFKSARHFHLDGYNFYYEDACRRALECALNEDCPISLDISSFEIAKSHFEMITGYLKSHAINLLFANEREAAELTGEKDPIRACEELSKYCPTVTVMMGEKGSVTAHKGQLYLKEIDTIKPLDTTGAGDIFIGGFLFGMLSDLSIEDCIEIGTATAAEGIQVFGGELPMKTLHRLRKKFLNAALV